MSRGLVISGDQVGSDMAIRSALQAAFRTTEHNFFQYANRLSAVQTFPWDRSLSCEYAG